MKKRIVVLSIVIGLICSAFFVPSVSAEEGATITIIIYKIGKEDPVGSWIDGEADWSYRLWIDDGKTLQDSGWIPCTHDTDNPLINIPYSYSVYSPQISFTIALKNTNVVGEVLADISSKYGGGVGSFNGDNYGNNARYEGTWNLVTNALSGDQTDIVELAGENYYWTSGSKDGSESVDEYDASLWFDISDNYDSPVAEARSSSTETHIGESISFDASYSSSSVDIMEYYWDFQSDGQWDDQNKITNYIYNTKETYIVTLKIVDSLGEESFDTCIIEVVNILPVAAFVYSPNDYPHPTTLDIIQFTDTSTDEDGTLAAWYWDFGDGSTSTERNPTHNFSLGKAYSVSLKVTDNDGGYDTETKYIIVIELATITGIVKDSDDSPISSATIKLYDAGTTTTVETATTSTDGTYTISEIPTGTYDIEASKNGYNSNKISSKTINSGENTVDFVLTSESDGTPGFELLFAFCAIVLVLLWKRKKPDLNQ